MEVSLIPGLLGFLCWHRLFGFTYVCRLMSIVFSVETIIDVTLFIARTRPEDVPVFAIRYYRVWKTPVDRVLCKSFWLFRKSWNVGMIRFLQHGLDKEDWLDMVVWPLVRIGLRTCPKVQVLEPQTPSTDLKWKCFCSFASSSDEASRMRCDSVAIKNSTSW